MKQLEKSMILILLLAVAAISSRCDSNRMEAVPAEMKGEWASSAPKFKGFSFEISDDTLAFIDRNAEEPYEIYPISKIEKDEEEPFLHVLYYRSMDSREYKFTFYFDPSNGGTITLKNQRKYTWKKVNK